MFRIKKITDSGRKTIKKQWHPNSFATREEAEKAVLDNIKTQTESAYRQVGMLLDTTEKTEKGYRLILEPVIIFMHKMVIDYEIVAC